LDQLHDLRDLPCLLLGQREPEVEREVAPVRRDVRELPAHAPLVRRELLDRRPRERNQRHIHVTQMKARAVEAVREARAAGAGSERVVRAVHHVVCEQLGASLEQLGERLLAVLGVELVVLLQRHPWKLPPLLRELTRSLGVLRLQLRELVTGRLPLLARSGCVRRHRLLLRHHMVRVVAPRPASSSATGPTRDAPKRGTFSTSTSAATTSIHVTLIAPSASSTSIRPALQPTQCTPQRTPAARPFASVRTPSRQ